MRKSHRACERHLQDNVLFNQDGSAEFKFEKHIICWLLGVPRFGNINMFLVAACGCDDVGIRFQRALSFGKFQRQEHHL